jgi:hypothetical protein
MERIAVVGVGWAAAEAADLRQHRALDVTERYRAAAEATARCYPAGAPGLRETRLGVVGVRPPR